MNDLKPNMIVGRWTLVERRGQSWVCRCSCGNLRLVVTYNLRHGRSATCGECKRLVRPPGERARIILDLADQGMKQSEIASRLGITRQAIFDTLQRHGRK
jgi:transcriptional regulator of acetoin/glycerol metabolism